MTSAARIHAIWCLTVGCGCIAERDTGRGAEMTLSLRDKLTDRGWTECGTCGGEGCQNGFRHEANHCPDCVEGLVPPEGMVEAAAKRAYSGHRLPIDEEWDSELMPVEVVDLWLSLIRAVLVAAARWEREQ